MEKTFLLVWIILVLVACSEKKQDANPQVLMDVDRAFSDYSIKNGYQKAFIEFADDSVVLLKPNQMPIIGKQSLIDSYNDRSDSNQMLTWKPAKSIIAESGELGYTYGFWTFIAKNDTSHGTYMTVWKKNADRKWKYIADTGNDGLTKRSFIPQKADSVH